MLLSEPAETEEPVILEDDCVQHIFQSRLFENKETKKQISKKINEINQLT